jgi:hypothetical protein
MNYQPVPFDARGADGSRIYHTNVMLSIGSRWAVVCAECIDAADRERVLHSLAASGRDLIQIPAAAISAFAANILELRGGRARGSDDAVLLLSEQARAALQAAGARAWERLVAGVERVVAAAIPTIESVGGGSVRCMLAEVPQVCA